MITIDYCFNFGMAIGIFFAEEEVREEEGIDWGVILMLGPINIYVEKETV